MPLRRYIFNTLTVVSVLLMLGVVGLWVRSYWVADDFRYFGSQLPSDPALSQTYAIYSGCGEVSPFLGPQDMRETLEMAAGINSTGPPYPFHLLIPDTYLVHRSMPPYDLNSVYGHKGFVHQLGFGYNQRTYKGLTSYELILPYWLITIGFAVTPLIWLLKWRRRKLGPPVCPSCGYDLTGNESGVCSECGVGSNANA